MSDAVAEMKRGAVFSPCLEYRYLLVRTWDESLPTCAFVMLNPSTADERIEDPTVRRCIGFARSWGFGTLRVYNIFALRSTDPKALYAHPDPIGPENDRYLDEIETGILIVAAWGVHGKLRGRGFYVRRRLQHRLTCLRTTMEGHPIHPLYVAGATKLRPYPFAPGDVS